LQERILRKASCGPPDASIETPRPTGSESSRPHGALSPLVPAEAEDLTKSSHPERLRIHLPSRRSHLCRCSSLGLGSGSSAAEREERNRATEQRPQRRDREVHSGTSTSLSLTTIKIKNTNKYLTVDFPVATKRLVMTTTCVCWHDRHTSSLLSELIQKHTLQKQPIIIITPVSRGPIL